MTNAFVSRNREETVFFQSHVLASFIPLQRSTRRTRETNYVHHAVLPKEIHRGGARYLKETWNGMILSFIAYNSSDAVVSSSSLSSGG